MKRWIVIPLMFIIATIGSGLSLPNYDGILLKDTNFFNRLKLQSGGHLKEIIVIPENSFNIEEVTAIIHRLDKLPVNILRDMKKKGIKVVLFNGKLTDNPSASHLKGIVPRGYPKHIVWDDVPGIGGSKIVLVKIGHSAQGKGHGSANLEYHEIGHSLYHYIFNNDSLVSEITSMWKKDAEAIFPEQSYFLDYKEEYFAESFALYFYSVETRSRMKQVAPSTYAFFDRLN